MKEETLIMTERINTKKILGITIYKKIEKLPNPHFCIIKQEGKTLHIIFGNYRKNSSTMQHIKSEHITEKEAENKYLIKIKEKIKKGYVSASPEDKKNITDQISKHLYTINS